MRLNFILVLSLFTFSCIQNKVDKNGERSTAVGQLETNHLHKFSNMEDTVVVRYYLDTIFESIGPTIAEFGSDRAFSYSDGGDSLFILVYWLNHPATFTDSIKLREYLTSGSIMFDHIKVSNMNGKQYAIFYEFLSPHYYLTCQVADSTEWVSFEILYQTTEIDSSNIAVFNRLCNSFNFYVLKK